MLLNTTDFDKYMTMDRTSQLWFTKYHRKKILRQVYNKGYTYKDISETYDDISQKEYWNERYLVSDATYAELYSKGSKLYFSKTCLFPYIEIQYKKLNFRERKLWNLSDKKQYNFQNNRLIEMNFN